MIIQMSENVRLSKATTIRLPKIKDGLTRGLTRDEIGVLCHVTEKTIRRDIKAWLRYGDFKEWIQETWLDLYGEARKDNIDNVFREVTKILIKAMPQIIESTSDITVKKEVSPIDVRKFTPEEHDEITRVVRLIAAKRRGVMGENQP